MVSELPASALCDSLELEQEEHAWRAPQNMTKAKSPPADLYGKFPPESVVKFQRGLPGFPEEHDFVILQDQAERPFAWMQSLKTPALSFVITSPFVLFPDYRPDVPDDELAALGSPRPEEIQVMILVRVVDQSPPELHVNLKAPIVVNMRTLAAGQVVLANETIYSERAVYALRPSAAEGNAAP